MLGFPACTIFICLLCQLAGLAVSGVPKKLTGAFGGSVIFPLTSAIDQIDSIVWHFNNDTLIIIKPENPNDTVIVTKNCNRERVKYLPKNYSLELNTLTKKDSGAYHVKIHRSSSREPFEPFIQHYRLRVYEHLPKPKVSWGLQSSENGTCTTNLTCSIEQDEEDVTYNWLLLGQEPIERLDGPIFPISWGLEKLNVTFMCVVRNPVSNSSSNPLPAQKLCEGAVGDQKYFVILLVVILFVALLFILTAWLKRQKTSTKEKKGMDVLPEVPNYDHSSGETTLYETINPHNTVPEENSPNTLYYIVQKPKMVDKPLPLPRTPNTFQPFA